MTQEQIVGFKKAVRKFNDVTRPIANHWDTNGAVTLSVLMQNLGSDGSDCQGYNLKEAVDDVNSLMKMIKAVCEYNDSHFENWIKQELDCLYFGAVYEEEDFK